MNQLAYPPATPSVSTSQTLVLPHYTAKQHLQSCVFHLKARILSNGQHTHSESLLQIFSIVKNIPIHSSKRDSDGVATPFSTTSGTQSMQPRNTLRLSPYLPTIYHHHYCDHTEKVTQQKRCQRQRAQHRSTLPSQHNTWLGSLPLHYGPNNLPPRMPGLRVRLAAKKASSPNTISKDLLQ